MKTFLALLALVSLLAFPASADPFTDVEAGGPPDHVNEGHDAPVTPATQIHGTPGNVPGFGGNSANPNGRGVNGGNGIHNIAGGAPEIHHFPHKPPDEIFIRQ